MPGCDGDSGQRLGAARPKGRISPLFPAAEPAPRYSLQGRRFRLPGAARALPALALALLAAPAAAQDTDPPGVKMNGFTLTRTQIHIAYDEELDDLSVPATNAFTVTIAGVSESVSLVQILDETVGGVTTSTVRVTTAQVFGPGEAVTIAYAKPAANPLRDTSGNDAPAFAATSVTNNAAWSTVTIASGNLFLNSRMRLTMSDRIRSLDPASNRFTVTAGGTDSTPTTVDVSVAGTSPTDPGIVTLNGINPPVAKGDTVTVSYSPARTATLNGQRLVDNSVNLIPAVTNLSVTNNAAELIASAVAVGNKVTLTYSGTLGTQVPDKGELVRPVRRRLSEQLPRDRGQRERVDRDADDG